MGMDSHASIGYGFCLPLELSNQETDIEELLDDKDRKKLEYIFAGNSFSEYFKTIVIISKSEIGVYTWEGGDKMFNPTKLKTNKNWDKILKSWAEKHKITNPKIGWYLCTSF